MKFSITSNICAVAAAALYYVLVFTHLFRDGAWSLFGLHLLLAGLGAVAGLWGIWKMQWYSIPGAIICVLILVVQVGGLRH